jgi:hypothetical protein
MITRRSLLAAGAALALVPRARAEALLPPIQASGLAVELVDWLTLPRTRSKKPYACLNQLKPWGTFLYICDTRGKLYRVDPATRRIVLWLDMALARNGALVTVDASTGADAIAWGGFRDFAFDPLGTYLYTSSVETVASRPAGTRVFNGDFTPLYDCVLAEWRIKDGKPVTASRRELFRIEVWQKHHNLEPLLFGPGGALFIGMGDGGNNPALPDPYNRAQDLGYLLGKWLRIRPYRTSTAPYTIPSSNPFRGVAGARPEIYALGLRHPMNGCLRDRTSGPLIFSDVGQARIEEVNLLQAGANYGWPLREGPFTTTRGGYEGEPLISEPTTTSIDPVACWDQEAEPSDTVGQAIIGGYVDQLTLPGQYLAGDLVRGRIFHVPAASLAIGQQTALQELTLLRNGSPVTLRELTGTYRADLRFGQDSTGEVYILTKQDGIVRRMRAAT